MTATLESIRFFLIDMDGVLYEGNRPLPGGKEFLNYLKERGLGFQLVTNNSTLAPAQYVGKLAGMGIEIVEAQVITSGQAAVDYLKTIAPPGAPVYIIGEEGLVRPALDAGFKLTEDKPKYVIMGLDRQFSYAKLKTAYWAISDGAEFIASNLDMSLPTETRPWPGSGAIGAAIHACTGVSPKVIGKPEGEMLRMAMRRMGATLSETLAIGDRLDTDIVGAHRAGLTSALVLTGITHETDLVDAAIKPDYVFTDLTALRQALEAAARL